MLVLCGGSSVAAAGHCGDHNQTVVAAVAIGAFDLSINNAQMNPLVCVLIDINLLNTTTVCMFWSSSY